MKKKRWARPWMLALTLGAGAAHAHTDAPSAITPGTPLPSLVHFWQALDAEPGMVAVCKDTWSQELCRVDLANGDFEAPNDPRDPLSWQLDADPHVPAPYLGATSGSRVLALPGKGARAMSGALLPEGSTTVANPEHTYSVKLRARGSGPLPADVAVTLIVAGVDDTRSGRDLASVTHTVGWDWVDIDFKVDGIVSPAPALLMVRIERTDNNTPTMLQVDDVRIVRTPLGVTSWAR